MMDVKGTDGRGPVAPALAQTPPSAPVKVTSDASRCLPGPVVTRTYPSVTGARGDFPNQFTETAARAVLYALSKAPSGPVIPLVK